MNGLCGDSDCSWFGYAHAASHPCGRKPTRLGDPCEFCGVAVTDQAGCIWCWTPVFGVLA